MRLWSHALDRAVADGDPGGECQIDFGRLGMMFDPVTGRRRALHALIFTAVFSRHMFVWLSFTQTLADVIAGCEAAWDYYGGVFKVLVPDNMKPVVVNADPINPTFSVGCWTMPSPGGSAPTRRGSARRATSREWSGLSSTYAVTSSPARCSPIWPTRNTASQAWCATTAGLRVHGTTAQRPAEHFAADERHQLLPVPAIPYDVPVFATPKVAPDRHVEVLRALYSVPGELIGQRVEARADSRLVQDLLPGSADQDPSAQAARRPLDRPHRLPGRPGRLRAARRASVDKEVGPGWRLDRRGHSDARLVTDLK